MKNYLIILALVVLSGLGLHAQTNTNTFVVTAPAPWRSRKPW